MFAKIYIQVLENWSFREKLSSFLSGHFYKATVKANVKYWSAIGDEI